jgi:hypothetical protein
LFLLFFFFLDMFPPKHASLGRVILVMLDRRTSDVFHPLWKIAILQFVTQKHHFPFPVVKRWKLL